MRLLALATFVLLVPISRAEPPAPARPAWKALAPGVEWAELALPRKSRLGDSRLTVVRIDPARSPVVLLSATALKLPSNPTAEGWASQQGLLAVTNAGMFQLDHRTPVGHAKAGGEVLNPDWKATYKSVLVADPVDPSLPAARILDPACDGDVKAIAARYRTVLQSLRMIDCHGKNVWADQPREWSTAAVASDAQGRLLFLHARSPYRVHDLDEMLLALPLGITRAIYMEGGPEASLHIAAPDGPVRRFGSYETGFVENDDNDYYWDLPNVLAVRKPGPVKP